MEALNDGKWRAPFVGCIKFNVDGLRSEAGDVVACEGVARDHNGAVMNGFMFKVGKGSLLLAETWGVVWPLK